MLGKVSGVEQVGDVTSKEALDSSRASANCRSCQEIAGGDHFAVRTG
jgi:hypothetical protein